MNQTESVIKNTIDQSISGLKLPAIEYTIEHPANESHGDYSSNVALQLFPHLKEKGMGEYNNPKELAQIIADQLVKDLPGEIKKVEVAGPGFINFHLNPQTLINQLQHISSLNKGIVTQQLKDEKVVVEYTDPNPFKELHLGHLFSNIIGESIARLYEANSAKVWRANFYGDVGMHVAKSIFGIKHNLESESKTIDEIATKDLSTRQEYLGKGYALGVNQYEENNDAKKSIDQLNTMIYVIAQELHSQKKGWQAKVDYRQFMKSGNFDYQEIKELYRQGLEWSLEYFESLYQILDTKFDGYYPESLMGEYGYEFVKQGAEKGVFEKSDEAIIFPGENFGLHTRVFINKTGLPTYETKDIGLAPAKFEDFPYSKSIIVTGNEITEYFKVVLEAMRQVNPKLGNITTVLNHGMIKLPEGKMSSRTGNIITVEGLIEEAKQRALNIINQSDIGSNDIDPESLSSDVGIASIRYALLKGDVTTDVVFDFDKSVSFEGNSGPYLQYTHARCASVIKKAKISDPLSLFLDGNGSGNYQINSQELSLNRHLIKFLEVVAKAANSLAPHIICTYLYELAKRYNTFYNAHTIIVKDNPAALNYRLALTQATATVLKTGLHLLGIKAPDRM